MSLYARGKREHALLTEEGVYASSGPCWREDTEPAGFQCDPDRNPLISTEAATHKKYTGSQFKTNTVQLKTWQKQAPSISSSSQDQCPSAVRGFWGGSQGWFCSPRYWQGLLAASRQSSANPPLQHRPGQLGVPSTPLALTCCPSQPFFSFPKWQPTFHFSPYRSVRAHMDIRTSQGMEQTLLHALPEFTHVWSCMGATRVRQGVSQDIF